MPALEAPPIGHCPLCWARLALSDGKTTPWHQDGRGHKKDVPYVLFGLDGCAGTDQAAVDIEKPKPVAETPAPLLSGKRGRK